MGKLWKYEDYVDHLTHKNDLVKRWAFHALEHRYINRFTDEVHLLLDTAEDENLVCSSLRYLAHHKAVQHAPKILEMINHSNDIISSNSISTLGKLKYEPATDTIIERLEKPIGMNDYFSLIRYLGMIRSEKTRSVLQSATIDIKEEIFIGPTFSWLLHHYHPEDIDLVFNRIESLKNIQSEGLFIKNFLNPVNGGQYHREIYDNHENNILSNPAEALKNLLFYNSHIEFDPELQEKIINTIRNDQYKDLTTMIMFASKDIINHRYPEDPPNDALKELQDQDLMALALLQELPKRSIVWRNIKKNDTENRFNRNLVATVISIFCTIIERGHYVKTLYQDCTDQEQLIESLKKAGHTLPKRLQEAIVESLSSSDLKSMLRDNFDTWVDIWTVRIMGRIGNKVFVPDLLSVISKTDSLDYVFNYAVSSLTALEESADAEILDAIQKNDLDEWKLFPIIEHFPYSETYDIAVRLWDDESCEMDSYDIFASTLENIGDKRGIKKLQDIFNTENNDAFIGDSLDCLAEIHQVDLPEMPDIILRRKEQLKHQEARKRELEEIARMHSKRPLKGDIFEEEPKIETYKRSTPKIGRNDPCPCGSGKKYKKCCLK